MCGLDLLKKSFDVSLAGVEWLLRSGQILLSNSGNSGFDPSVVGPEPHMVSRTEVEDSVLLVIKFIYFLNFARFFCADTFCRRPIMVHVSSVRVGGELQFTFFIWYNGLALMV